jgi:hypothetical protein
LDVAVSSSRAKLSGFSPSPDTPGRSAHEKEAALFRGTASCIFQLAFPAQNSRCASQYPLWVMSGHSRRFVQCPFDPRKRTLLHGIEMSAPCQRRTWRVETSVCPKTASFRRRDLVPKAHRVRVRDIAARGPFCPCTTNALMDAPQGCRSALAAHRSCGLLE